MNFLNVVFLELNFLEFELFKVSVFQKIATISPLVIELNRLICLTIFIFKFNVYVSVRLDLVFKKF